MTMKTEMIITDFMNMFLFAVGRTGFGGEDSTGSS